MSINLGGGTENLLSVYILQWTQLTRLKTHAVTANLELNGLKRVEDHQFKQTNDHTYGLFISSAF